MASCFAFLPHVRVPLGQQIRVGPFILWCNESTEWVRRFGVDNTAFFEMYRDERGDPVGEKASILSKPDYSDASNDEFRDAVYCLSTMVWLRGRTASDAWVFERWLVDVPTPPDLAYLRAAKFSMNFTSANFDRVYPTPYTHRIDVSSNDQEAINHFAQELAKPREASMLVALSHFHLARFDTPYFTSPGDSVEAMWSGFESLLEIDRFGPVKPVPSPSSGGRCARVLRLARKLISKKDSRARVDKDERLQRALRAEFSKHADIWRPELWDGVATWSKQFYRERNHHSHGARVDLVTKTVDPYGLSAFEIALHLARAVLRLRWLGDNSFFEVQIAEEMNTLFFFAPVIKRVTAALRDYDRKAWYPGVGGTVPQLTPSQIEAFHRDLSDLSTLRSDSRQFRKDSQVTQARQKMGLVLSAWISDLLKQPPMNITLGAVANMPALFSSLVAQKKNADEIHTELANMLSDGGADNLDAYGATAGEPRMLLHGRIPLWLWVAGYIKLTEAWLGYRIK